MLLWEGNMLANLLKRFWQGVNGFNRRLYAIGSLFIVFLAVVTLIDVTGRYFLNMPLKGSLEISELLMASVIFLCLPYSFSLKAHINVDILLEKVSPRKKIFLEALTSILTLFFLFLIVWQGARIALTKRLNYTDVLHIPTFPFGLMVPIGYTLASLFIIGYAIATFSSLRKK
jgi:TRAP-type C4-dicarboxylate transport system permease small subunit